MGSLELRGRIEAILFAWGDPVSLTDLSKATGENVEEVQNAIAELDEHYQKPEHGLEIIQINESYQVTTKDEAQKSISRLITPEKKKNLSRATLETLSIVVYKQPITKNEIERIRGVKSDKALSNLIQENLIFEKDRLQKIGRPIVYATTDYFLKRFGFKSLEELPKLSTYESKEPQDNNGVEE